MDSPKKLSLDEIRRRSNGERGTDRPVSDHAPDAPLGYNSVITRAALARRTKALRRAQAASADSLNARKGLALKKLALGRSLLSQSTIREVIREGGSIELLVECFRTGKVPDSVEITGSRVLSSESWLELGKWMGNKLVSAPKSVLVNSSDGCADIANEVNRMSALEWVKRMEAEGFGGVKGGPLAIEVDAETEADNGRIE